MKGGFASLYLRMERPPVTAILHQITTCQRCGCPLPGSEGGHRRCSTCGFEDLPSLRRFQRTREPRAALMEQRARSLIASVACVLVLWSFLLPEPGGFLVSQPVALVCTLVALCAAFWACARMVNRRPAREAVMLVAAALWALPLLGLLTRAWRDVPGEKVPLLFGVLVLFSLAGGAWLLLVARIRLRAVCLANSARASPATDLPVMGPARCLRCRATLPGDTGMTRRCPDCGLKDTPLLRRTFWNLDPGLLRLERVLKALVVLLCAALGGLVLLFPPSMIGPGSGASLALPVVLATVLWQTVSKLTHHEVLFSAALFWKLLFWIPAALLTPLVAASMLRASDIPQDTFEGEIVPMIALWAGCIVLGLLVIPIIRLLTRWKLARETRSSSFPADM